MCGICIPHTAFGLHSKVLQFTVWLHYKAWKVIMIILKKNNNRVAGTTRFAWTSKNPTAGKRRQFWLYSDGLNGNEKRA